MADNEIKVLSESVSTLSTTLKKLELDLVRGDKTVTEYTTAVLAARDAFAATKVSTDQLIPGMLKVEAAMNKAAGAARGGIVSAIQGMEISINKTRPLVTSFSQAIQDSGQFSMGAAQGIRSVANNVEMMAQQFAYLKSSGMATTDIFKQMIAALRGPMGLLLAVSAFGMAMEVVSAALTSTKKEAREAKKAVEDLIPELLKLRGQLGYTGGPSYAMYLEGRNVALQHEKEKILGVDEKMKSPREFILGKSRILTEEQNQRILAIDLERLKNEKEIYDIQKKGSDDAERAHERELKAFREQIGMMIAWRDMVAGGVSPGSISTKGGLLPYTFFDTKGQFSGNLNQQISKLVYPDFKFKPEGGTKLGSYKSNMDYLGAMISEDNQKESESRAQHLTSFMMSRFKMATNVLGDGIATSLNIGNSLAGKLANTLLSIGLQLGSAQLLSWAFPSLGGFMGALKLDNGGVLNQPVLGVGMNNGQIYKLAWDGNPERVTPESSNRMGQQGRYGASGGFQPVVYSTVLIDDGGIANRVEIGTRQNRDVRLGRSRK